MNAIVLKTYLVLRRKHGLKLASNIRGIAGPPRSERANVAENGMPNLRCKLMEKLISDCQGNPRRSQFSKHVGERQGCKRLWRRSFQSLRALRCRRVRLAVQYSREGFCYCRRAVGHTGVCARLY